MGFTKFWKHIRINRNQILAVLIPLLLLPLPLWCKGEQKALCGYVLLWLSMYQVFQVVPLGISALLPLIMFPLLAITDSKSASAAYSSEAVWVFFGVLLCGIAFEKVKLHQRAAYSILHFVGPQPSRILWSFALISFSTSMVIANVGAAITVLTILDAMISESQKAITDIEKYEILVKENHTDDEEQDSEQPNIEKKHKHRSNHTQKESESLTYAAGIVIKFGCILGGMSSPIGTPLNIIVMDLLDNCVSGSSSETPLTFATWFVSLFPVCLVIVASMTILTQVYYFGLRSFSAKTEDRNTYHLKKWIDKQHSLLGSFRYEEVVVMVQFLILAFSLFFLRPNFMPGWADLKIFKESYVGPVVPVILIGSLFFIIPAKSKLGQSYTTDDINTTNLVESTRDTIMDWVTVKNRMPWQIVILIGASHAAAAASKKSGLQYWMKEVIEGIPIENETTLLFVLCVLSAFATEILSSTLMLQIMVPVLCDLAVSLGKNCLYFAIPVAFCINTNFMMPNHGVNALCLDFKKTKIIHLITTGFVADILFICVITVCHLSWFITLFKLDVVTQFDQQNTTQSYEVH